MCIIVFLTNILNFFDLYFTIKYTFFFLTILYFTGLNATLFNKNFITNYIIELQHYIYLKTNAVLHIQLK
jgi:hypothetical protein